MRPTTVTVTSQTTSAPIVVDYAQNAFGIGFALVITGTGTYKVQYTHDNVMDASVTPTWQDHPIVTGATATTSGNFAFPVRAVRLNCTAFTNGSGALTVLQGRK